MVFNTFLLNTQQYKVSIKGIGVQSWGQVIPKTLKMVLDATLLSFKYYKVRIKGKVE